jgi:hypothetical protein
LTRLHPVGDAYDEREIVLHRELIKLRHTVYAHSDSTNYSIRPWRTADFLTDILGGSVLRITAGDATQFLAMTAKLIASIGLLAAADTAA